MKCFDVLFAKSDKKGAQNHCENSFFRMEFREVENPLFGSGKRGFLEPQKVEMDIKMKTTNEGLVILRKFLKSMEIHKKD